MVVVEIFTCSKSLLLYTFYHPPGSNNVDLNHLNSSLRSNSESSCVLVVGDFNIPALDWTDSSSPVNIGGNVIGDNFCDLMGDNFLFQFVHGPTHIAGNKLDLVLCNCPEVVDGVSTHSPGLSEFPSDHYIIDFSVRVKFHRANPVRRKVYDFKRGNFAELRSSLEHVPFDVAFSENIDEYWLAWKDLFLTTVSEFIPIKTVKDTNSPPWMDSDARHYLRKKYTALRKYRRRRTATNKLKLRTLSQEVKYVIRSKHRDYLKKIESSFKDNPKLFWSYHKAVLHSCGKPSVISYNGATATSSADKAELFNSYFSSVFRPQLTTNVNTSHLNIHEQLFAWPLLSELTISVND